MLQDVTDCNRDGEILWNKLHNGKEFLVFLLEAEIGPSPLGKKTN
jgi:hypothetical protein